MKYPSMPEREKRLRIPGLSGGLRESGKHKDNELAKVRNLWWKDEGLRTRPGIRAAGTPLPDEGGTLDYGGEDRLTGADGGYGRTVLRTKKVNGLLHAALDTIYYDGRLETGTLTSTGSAAESGCLLPVNGCVEAAGGRQENLLLTDAGELLANVGGEWVSAQEAVYKPLVYVDVAPFSGTYTLSGRAFEARNLLSPDYRIRYTPDGENTTFAILSRSVKLHSLQVVINRAGAASVIHTLISEDPGGSAILMETTPAADGLRMYYVGLRGGFFFLNNIDEESKPLFQGFPNSIEATICPAEEGEAERRLVGGMKHSIWYSNDRSGAGGGARLFVGGNPDKPNLICWSGLNNPLYFPEENKAYVGDPGTAVTAFAKQGEMLLLFKADELYRTSYAAGEGLSTQSLGYGRVYEETAYTARFPIIQISGQVGCDCPGTLCLCGEKLLWAHSKGKVYALQPDRSIRELSTEVRSRLGELAGEPLKTASAGEFHGYYLLLAGSRALLYNCAGEAGWYAWDFSLPGTRMQRLLVRDDRAIIDGKRIIDGLEYRLLFALEGEKDREGSLNGVGDAVYVETPVSWQLATGRMELGLPERKKRIGPLFLELDGSPEGRVDFCIEMDGGSDVESCRCGVGGDQPRLLRLIPGGGRTTGFNLKVQGTGRVCFGRLIIDWKEAGSSRGADE